MQKPRPSGMPMLGRVRVKRGRTKGSTRGRERQAADAANLAEACRQIEESRFMSAFAVAVW